MTKIHKHRLIEDDDEFQNSPENSSSPSDNSSPGKKMRYNILEQERRQIHKTLYEEIRKALPGVSKNASNRKILTEAIKFNKTMLKFHRICDKYVPKTDKLLIEAKKKAKELGIFDDNPNITPEFISSIALFNEKYLQEIIHAYNMIRRAKKMYSTYMTKKNLVKNLSSSDESSCDISEGSSFNLLPNLQESDEKSEGEQSEIELEDEELEMELEGKESEIELEGRKSEMELEGRESEIELDEEESEIELEEEESDNELENKSDSESIDDTENDIEDDIEDDIEGKIKDDIKDDIEDNVE